MTTMTESATSVAPETVRYRLDPAGSTFTAQAFAGGLLAGFGHSPVIGIRSFDGEVKFVAGTLADASVRITVAADSLSIVDGAPDKDRPEIEHAMAAEVLETSRYPEINFQSTNVTITRIVEGRYKARIIGDLTLHGVTQKGLWIAAQITLNENELRARGDFTIKQTDYNIKRASVAGGALKVKDEVSCTFDLVATSG